MRRLWRRSKTATVGLVLTALLFVSAAAAPLLAPHAPEAVPRDLVRASLQPPSPRHPLGTDLLGRDVLSRVIYGARISLLVGFGAELVAVVLGVAVGMLAGYAGGWTDALLMRLTDTFLAFPSLVLAIAMMAAFQQPGLLNVVVVLSLLGWTGIARVMRAQTLVVMGRDFVQSAQAAGAGTLRILLRYVLPNCLAPLMVAATIGIAGNILAEAGLSFLGIGVSPPTPSWGLMLAQGRSELTTHPWVTIFPGLAIMLTVLGLNLLGDGLRDLLDPQLRR
ncbi:MAG: ABC transporter permease [Candidatus Tectomicrobia bacterium]|nr:ABC transporter permease [Candidatus Tectomicrobia bacterium]